MTEKEFDYYDEDAYDLSQMKDRAKYFVREVSVELRLIVLAKYFLKNYSTDDDTDEFVVSDDLLKHAFQSLLRYSARFE